MVESLTVVTPMGTEEARLCVDAIRHHMDSARKLLLDLYERRGWEALGYESWRECAAAEFEQGERQLYRQLQAAQIERHLTHVTNTPVPERTLRPLAKVTPMEQPVVWKEAVETAPNGKVTAAHVEQVVERHLDPMAVHFSSSSPEWYTPKDIIERAIAVMGGIDLDPCSNKGVPNVPASKHYTEDDDGLAWDWEGRVYMNPPYGRGIGEWVTKLMDDYAVGICTAAIALVPARTDTDWFRKLRDTYICFIDGRLKFSGHQNSAPFPSAVIYIGPNEEGFIEHFGAIGDIWRRVE